jgi:hypothetical protein
MISIVTALIISTALANSQPSGCECPRSIGAAAGAPPLIVIYDAERRPSLIACGYLHARQSQDKVTASEFQVFRCGSDVAILTFGALQRCILESMPSKMKITEISRWPFGLNWSWVDVPIWQYMVYANVGRPIEKRIVLSPPILSKRQVEDTLKNYALLRQSLASEKNRLALAADLENMIGRILVVALMGNPRGRRHLESMRSELTLDGHMAEIHSEAVSIYNSYAQEIESTGVKIWNSLMRLTFCCKGWRATLSSALGQDM